jgi:SAM-dependent methyltransferase
LIVQVLLHYNPPRHRCKHPESTGAAVAFLKVGTDLYHAVADWFSGRTPGKVLDVGTGDGRLSSHLHALGYTMAACDCIPENDWHLKDILYRQCDIAKGLPFDNESFDYVVCTEVIEHVENPFALCREIKRVLRPGGAVIMSTPNILNLRSRFKFLLDGSFLFYNYPPIEWDQKEGRPHVHAYPIRYHELEYYLYKAGLTVDDAFTNLRSYSWRLFFPMELLLRLHARHMEKRSQRKDHVALERIYRRILSDDLLFGTHLIVHATRS